MAKQRNRGNNQKQFRKDRREQRRGSNADHSGHEIAEMELHTARQLGKASKVEPLAPQTEAQAHYMMSIEEAVVTFGIGPAGTGKTFVCAAMAADMLTNHEIEQIIITRPAVDAGESLGFLPGELDEKFEPYLQPFRDVFTQRLGHSQYEYMLKSRKIEPAVLGHMRGRTFRNAFVILDEAQNVTPSQMKMFLTRIGPNCTVVVNGDPRQKDISGESGLIDAVSRLESLGKVRVARFDREDVVRSGIVQDIIERYED